MTLSTLQNFLEVFSSLFQERDVITADSNFRELEEWSSMQALIVIATIDEHFGVTIPERDFRAAQTVSDLYQLIINP
ncbi:acyl carrier protein [Flavobacteriales bacterium]|nr:acyl carrier protein [Flavobacteriales bacterium]